MSRSTAIDRPFRYSSSLPPVARTYLNLRTAVEVIAPAIALAALIPWVIPEAWILLSFGVLTALLVVALAVEVPVLNRLSVQSTSYEVDSLSVRIRKGVVLPRDTVISTAQILNVTVTTGPLLRRFGLAKVKFTTIAHGEPFGPVTLSEANAIRTQVLAIYLGNPNEHV